jgi:hypothetical protein
MLMGIGTRVTRPFRWSLSGDHAQEGERLPAGGGRHITKPIVPTYAVNCLRREQAGHACVRTRT